MGMDRTVRFPGAPPAWEAVRDLLAAHGFAVQVRMIDGELAFPDEAPPPSWRELRLGTPQGMVTVRRAADRVECVVWGNADAGLRRAWDAVAWAFAEAGGGLVADDGGERTAAQFRTEHDLSDGPNLL